jgi:hypothetical protein
MMRLPLIRLETTPTPPETNAAPVTTFVPRVRLKAADPEGHAGVRGGIADLVAPASVKVLPDHLLLDG